MFLAFILQVVFRYLLNLPIGWTNEISVVLWLWLVLWGAAFVLREDEEIRFDLIYGAVGPRARRAMFLVSAGALVALYVISLSGGLRLRHLHEGRRAPPISRSASTGCSRSISSSSLP